MSPHLIPPSFVGGSGVASYYHSRRQLLKSILSINYSTCGKVQKFTKFTGFRDALEKFRHILIKLLNTMSFARIRADGPLFCSDQ
jgi:hypothetical protein